ncbi:MAG TPA: hypothetical protein VFR67_09190 [Pilimelia sp.]|nr:hypothetical protein [Pilimelia sp.]
MISRRVGAAVAGLGAAAIVGIGVALALAAPAYAHGGDAPDGTNYRTRVSVVSPALPGVTVHAIEAGARLELANRGGKTVEVLGYDGEPYLEIRPDGVYKNIRSPATYLNATLTGGVAVPAEADPTAPPSWRRVAAEPVARWHDHRAHWMTAAKPPQVTADPGRVHRIRDWTVPLRVELSTAEIRGTLDWIPPPLPALWWAGAVVCAAALATLGLVAPGSRAAPMAARLLGALAVAGGLGAIAYAVAREIDAGKTGVGGVLLGLLASQVWPVLTALGAVAAGGYALLGRPAADFALALAGACLALFAGITNASVLASSIAPVPWPATAARTLVMSVIAIGAGLVVANALRMRAVARAAAGTMPAGDPASPAPPEVSAPGQPPEVSASGQPPDAQRPAAS